MLKSQWLFYPFQQTKRPPVETRGLIVVKKIALKNALLQEREDR